MQEESYNINSDVSSSGNWSAEILDELEPGLHTVHVSDNLGNEDSALLFITEAGEIQMSDQVTVVAPDQQVVAYSGFNWTLLVIIGFIFLINAYISLKIRHEETGKHKIIKTLATYTSIVSFILFIGLATFGIYKGTELGEAQKIIPNIASQDNPVKIASVSGILANPQTGDPVEGIDLRAGDVTIKTDNGGQFMFSSINILEGIRMTSPDLHKAILFIPEKEGRTDLMFDANLFNRIVEITYAESQEKTNDIRDFLTDNLNTEALKATFEEKYEKIYEYKNIADQEIIISGMKKEKNYRSILTGEKYKNVVIVTVVNEEKTAKRAFIYKDNEWKLVL